MDWRADLLAWYARSARDLPWRRTRDPWAILVSEVMLQQTRVETVLRRYERFLRRFPTPAALASASEGELLREWAGLGYYRRARHLRAASLALAAGIPRSAEGWEALPGVGRYTARAVAAIAQGERVLPVDGNVDRVLSRLLALDDPSPARRRAEIERRVAPPAAAGDFVQALFDLGATVCAPRAPRCGECPIAAACAGRAAGRADALPPRGQRAPAPVVHVAASLDVERGRIRLVRSDGEFLGGLWGLPHAEAPDAAAARRALGARGRPVVEYEHAFSMKRWRVAVYRRAASGGRRWPLAQLPPMARAWTKALDLRDRAPSSRPRRRSP